MKVRLGVGCFALLLAGCVSGAGEFQWGYHEEYTLSEKNRQALMNLRQGMSLDEVRAMMGEPQMVDQYPSETIGGLGKGCGAPGVGPALGPYASYTVNNPGNLAAQPCYSPDL